MRKFDKRTRERWMRAKETCNLVLSAAPLRIANEVQHPAPNATCSIM